MSDVRAGHLPYSGVPEVSQPLAPAEYQRIQATPRQFGVQVGEGLEALGAGAQKASDVYSEISAQQAVTSWRKQVNNLMFGDPDKPGDVGYFGLHGQAAMDARQGVRQKIEDATQQTLGGLYTARSQLMFNNEARFYQSRLDAEIGSHYDQESKAWGETVNNDQYQNAVAEAALRPQDEGAANQALASANAARTRRLQILGLLPMDASQATPEQLQVLDREHRQASVDILESRIHSMIGRGQTAPANELFQQNIGVLSGSRNFDALSSLLKRHASAAIGDAALRQAEGASSAAASIPKVEGGETVSHQQVVDFWKGKGAPEPAAQGIADRVGAESGFSSGAVGDGGTSVGLYQHHAERASALMQLADWQKPTTQNERAYQEVTGGDPTATAHWDEIKNAPTREAAAQLWDKYFERSKSGPAQAAPAVGASTTPQPSAMPQLQDLANMQWENDQRYARVLGALDANQTLKDDPEAYEHATRRAELEYRQRELAITGGKQYLLDSRAAALTDYTRAIMSGPVDPKLLDKATVDPRLDAETLQNVERFYLAHVKSGADGNAAKYGDAFDSVIHKFTLPSDNPDRIYDPTQLLKMVTPDGKNGLTAPGYDKAVEMMKSLKTPEGLGDTKIIDGALARAKRLLSFEKDLPGGMKMPDPKGSDAYNSGFLQAFFAHVDQGRGKESLSKLLSDDEIDPIIAQFKRQPSEMMRDMNEQGATLKTPTSDMGAAAVPGIPYGDVWLLHRLREAHPEQEALRREQFDQHYGPGAAAKVLGPPAGPQPTAPFAGGPSPPEPPAWPANAPFGTNPAGQTLTRDRRPGTGGNITVGPGQGEPPVADTPESER